MPDMSDGKVSGNGNYDKQHRGQFTDGMLENSLKKYLDMQLL